MSRTYDVAIIGAGVFGAWTAHHLQRAGLSIALIDAYGAGNSRSSSGGESRIIRMGYGADEIYTRWSMRALQLWQEFDAEHNAALFHRTGLLWLAGGDGAHARASLAIFTRLGVAHEVIARDELERRYPQINFGAIEWAICEPDSGVLMARRAVQTIVRAAIKDGVDYFTAAVEPLTRSGRLAEVATRKGEHIAANQFVFACGPWLPKLFPALLGEQIRPNRQEVFFFGTPPGDARFAPPQLPAWIDWSSETYGVPNIESRGFKVALDRHGPPIDPDSQERTPTPALLAEVRAFLSQRFPALANAPLVESRVCQYENTSNGDFLIDHHPDFANVWLVGGGSGHGFKHGPALGEYVAELVMKGGATETRFSLATKETVRQRSVY